MVSLDKGQDGNWQFPPIKSGQSTEEIDAHLGTRRGRRGFTTTFARLSGVRLRRCLSRLGSSNKLQPGASNRSLESRVILILTGRVRLPWARERTNGVKTPRVRPSRWSLVYRLQLRLLILLFLKKGSPPGRTRALPPRPKILAKGVILGSSWRELRLRDPAPSGSTTPRTSPAPGQQRP